jgi:hypothetical protein
MERDGFRFENRRFVSDMLRLNVVDVPSLIALTEASLAEHIENALFSVMGQTLVLDQNPGFKARPVLFPDP